MRTISIIAAATVVASASNVYAANLALVTTPPNILHMILLVVALASAVVSWKVLSAVRGGRLVRSWQLFLGGFVALSLGQIAYLLNVTEIFAVPDYSVPAVFVAGIGLLMYGIVETKRVLG